MKMERCSNGGDDDEDEDENIKMFFFNFDLINLRTQGPNWKKVIFLGV